MGSEVGVSTSEVEIWPLHSCCVPLRSSHFDILGCFLLVCARTAAGRFWLCGLLLGGPGLLSTSPFDKSGEPFGPCRGGVATFAQSSPLRPRALMWHTTSSALWFVWGTVWAGVGLCQLFGKFPADSEVEERDGKVSCVVMLEVDWEFDLSVSGCENP